jgi:hypothetical protein
MNQSAMVPNSDLINGSALARVRNTARELMSLPRAFRPTRRASIMAVPPPTNGSSTTSPGDEKHSIVARAKTGENRAGYLYKLCVTPFTGPWYRAASKNRAPSFLLFLPSICSGLPFGRDLSEGVKSLGGRPANRHTNQVYPFVRIARPVRKSM